MSFQGRNGCGFVFDPSPCLLPARRPSIPPSVRPSLPPSIPNHSSALSTSLCPALSLSLHQPSVHLSFALSLHPFFTASSSSIPSPHPSILPSLNPFQYSSVHHSLTVHTKPTQKLSVKISTQMLRRFMSLCHHIIWSPTYVTQCHQHRSVTSIATYLQWLTTHSLLQ